MEYEIKFKIEDKKGILRGLKALNAEDLGEETQTDIYLDLNGNGVRVRKVGKKGLITIKRIVEREIRAKVREEIETEVADVDSLIEIFKELGFIEAKRKEKIRHTFKLGNVFVLIDRLPFMGYFIELEATSETGLKRTSKKLAFDYTQGIGNSYDNLFFAYYIKNAKLFQDTKVKIVPVFKNEREFLGKGGCLCQKREVKRSGKISKLPK
ncbi:MAG: class IV adenylate cyclase [Candidatus Saganbacteria bacterium]|nr:class IV adenylate cyclase [Candidatus Saganbacteria bacterium]